MAGVRHAWQSQCVDTWDVYLIHVSSTFQASKHKSWVAWYVGIEPIVIIPVISTSTKLKLWVTCPNSHIFQFVSTFAAKRGNGSMNLDTFVIQMRPTSTGTLVQNQSHDLRRPQPAAMLVPPKPTQIIKLIYTVAIWKNLGSLFWLERWGTWLAHPRSTPPFHQIRLVGPWAELR